jgi:hypothetical protein
MLSSCWFLFLSAFATAGGLPYGLTARVNDVWIQQSLTEAPQVEAESALSDAVEENLGFLAGSIEGMKRRILAVRERGRVLLAGVRDETNDIPSVLNRITLGKGTGEFLRIVAKMMMLFGISLAAVFSATALTAFIVDTRSIIIAADVNLDHTVRPEPETALDILRRLKA